MVPRIVRVDYDVRNVQREAVWPGVIEEDSMWAFPKEGSYKRALRECLTKQTHYRKEASALQKYILEKFTAEAINSQFVSHITDMCISKTEENEWMESLGAIELSE